MSLSPHTSKIHFWQMVSVSPIWLTFTRDRRMYQLCMINFLQRRPDQTDQHQRVNCDGFMCSEYRQGDIGPWILINGLGHLVLLHLYRQKSAWSLTKINTSLHIVRPCNIAITTKCLLLSNTTSTLYSHCFKHVWRYRCHVRKRLLHSHHRVWIIARQQKVIYCPVFIIAICGSGLLLSYSHNLP